MNKYQRHIFVLPEDDANRQLANGFLLDASLNARAIQILRPSGGWPKVFEDFRLTHVNAMHANPLLYMILLVDFDEKNDRMEKALRIIPDDLKDRVFVIGVWSEPENLKQLLGKTYESIGTTLAQECREGTSNLWDHALLNHNAPELTRMADTVRPILFS